MFSFLKSKALPEAQTLPIPQVSPNQTDPRKVFFLSGMTVLGREKAVKLLLANHPQIGLVENINLKDLFTQLSEFAIKSEFSRDMLFELQPAIAEFLVLRKHRESATYSDKHLFVGLCANGEPFEYSPSARRIAVVRDPRETLVLRARQALSDGKYLTMLGPNPSAEAQTAMKGWLSDKSYFEKNPQALLQPAFVKQVLRRWTIVSEAALLDGRLSIQNCLLVLKYEDLISDPEGSRDKMLRHIGADPKLAGPLPDGERVEPNDWARHFSPEIIKEFGSDTKATMENFGYQL